MALSNNRIEGVANDAVTIRSTEGKTGARKRATLSRDTFTRVAADLRVAEAAVQDAQVALDNARQAESSAVQAAEQQVASAQANLDSVAAGADPEQISAARQQMASGQAQVARLNGAPMRRARRSATKRYGPECSLLTASIGCRPVSRSIGRRIWVDTGDRKQR